MTTIGVLALQGDFAEHEAKLRELGCEVVEIRQKKDLARSFDGLVLPGGESTTIGKLLRELDLFDELKTRVERGLPVFATCAGAILLASSIENDKTVHFGTMRTTVRRNAYGRQLGSFRTTTEVKGVGEIPATFIRAPYFVSAQGAEILATVDGKGVAARDGNQLALAFHPELDESALLYKYWLGIVDEYVRQSA